MTWLCYFNPGGDAEYRYMWFWSQQSQVPLFKDDIQHIAIISGDLWMQRGVFVLQAMGSPKRAVLSSTAAQPAMQRRASSTMAKTWLCSRWAVQSDSPENLWPLLVVPKHHHLNIVFEYKGYDPNFFMWLFELRLNGDCRLRCEQLTLVKWPVCSVGMSRTERWGEHGISHWS